MVGVKRNSNDLRRVAPIGVKAGPKNSDRVGRQLYDRKFPRFRAIFIKGMESREE
jgi:hypothetical protein